MAKESTKKETLIKPIAKKEETINRVTEMLTQDVTKIMKNAEINDRRITEVEFTCEDFSKTINELKSIVSVIRKRMGL
jgi:hypothetical protein